MVYISAINTYNHVLDSNESLIGKGYRIYLKKGMKTLVGGSTQIKQTPVMEILIHCV
jgi:hypothetical protein